MRKYAGWPVLRTDLEVIGSTGRRQKRPRRGRDRSRRKRAGNNADGVRAQPGYIRRALGRSSCRVQQVVTPETAGSNYVSNGKFPWAASGLLGATKKKDTRDVYLAVESTDGGFLAEVAPDRQKAAREIAVKINVLGKQLQPAAPATSEAATNGDIPDQIRKLTQLRDQGILTEEEFEPKKTELLDRL